MSLVALTPPDRTQWIVVNDDVMGGRSLGSLSFSTASVVFDGSLNTNGGGFASIRSLGLLKGLSSCSAVAIRVIGDGREWACDFRADARQRGFGVTWKTTFPTRAGEATVVRLPFTEFQPTWRGQRVPDHRLPPGDGFPGAMASIGFTIADGRDGAFRLEVLGVDTL